jgi:Methyltransferase domain
VGLPDTGVRFSYQMYQVCSSPRIENVLWSEYLPFQLNSDVACVLDGDWDLMATRNGPPPSTTDSAGPLPVAIGREGDLIADCRSQYTVHEGRVPVNVIGRHVIWDTFRREILAYAEIEGGETYVPLTHVDLCTIPFWTGPERAALIKSNLKFHAATVLDIGAFWGYICEELEKAGHNCTAVEIDEKNYYFMTRLRRAQRLSYRAILGDICEFVEKENTFDVVVALAVFHHFIKKEHRHRRLVSLLQKIKTKQMFFWAHNTSDSQMSGAYRNYAPEEFVEFILKNAGLNGYELLDIIDGRPLYQLT